MIKNLLDNIINKQDKNTLSVTFPDVLNRMVSDDANFELSVSNTIQKLDLFHKNSLNKPSYPNTVGKSIGLIFINNSKALNYASLGTSIK